MYNKRAGKHLMERAKAYLAYIGLENRKSSSQQFEHVSTHPLIVMRIHWRLINQ